jgi:hypothetical protein
MTVDSNEDHQLNRGRGVGGRGWRTPRGHRHSRFERVARGQGASSALTISLRPDGSLHKPEPVGILSSAPNRAESPGGDRLGDHIKHSGVEHMSWGMSERQVPT